MMHFHKPHSSEWFEALLKTSPQQARHTAQIVKLAGSDEVCSICGDHGGIEYQILTRECAPGVAATIRLCDHCKAIRERGLSDVFISLGR